MKSFMHINIFTVTIGAYTISTFTTVSDALNIRKCLNGRRFTTVSDALNMFKRTKKATVPRQKQGEVLDLKDLDQIHYPINGATTPSVQSSLSSDSGRSTPIQNPNEEAPPHPADILKTFISSGHDTVANSKTNFDGLKKLFMGLSNDEKKQMNLKIREKVQNNIKNGTAAGAGLVVIIPELTDQKKSKTTVRARERPATVKSRVLDGKSEMNCDPTKLFEKLLLKQQQDLSGEEEDIARYVECAKNIIGKGAFLEKEILDVEFHNEIVVSTVTTVTPGHRDSSLLQYQKNRQLVSESLGATSKPVDDWTLDRYNDLRREATYRNRLFLGYLRLKYSDVLKLLEGEEHRTLIVELKELYELLTSLYWTSLHYIEYKHFFGGKIEGSTNIRAIANLSLMKALGARDMNDLSLMKKILPISAFFHASSPDEEDVDEEPYVNPLKEARTNKAEPAISQGVVLAIEKVEKEVKSTFFGPGFKYKDAEAQEKEYLDTC